MTHHAIFMLELWCAVAAAAIAHLAYQEWKIDRREHQ